MGRVLNCCPYNIRASLQGKSCVFKIDHPIRLEEHSTTVYVSGFPYPVVEAFHREEEVLAVAKRILEVAQPGDLVLVSSLVGEALLDCSRARSMLEGGGVRILSPIVPTKEPKDVVRFRLWF